ncbi:hypothetical protein M8A51_05665 [Schlegelella sp. S2-27]|uniref:Tetratricopeptide repeat protein n=1 Tax=Caldimonas mangrovi TaxID=2944811 RepID=A0ABT0YJW4_9BURK|nr:hypothetical protein [Caldimonas mangrovi]MCM5679017.1 hypothetical protein [Caldimonas mangrovi]
MVAFLDEKYLQGADVCFIHFTSRTKKPGTFEKYPTPPGVSNVYVNCENNGWYLNGIPELGDMRTAATALSQRAKAAGASKIICIGASMGACGAALYAALMGAELIAFGTELWPNIYTGFSRENLAPDVRVDPSQLGTPSRALLLCGTTWLSDLICAHHFQRAWPSCRAVYLHNCKHESARFLKDRGVLPLLLEAFIRGESEEAAIAKVKTLPTQTVENLDVPAPAELDDTSLERFAFALSEHLTVGERMKIGTFLYTQKALTPAARYLAGLKAACGDTAEMTLVEVMTLRKLNRYAEALQLLRSIERNPYFREQALWYKALLLEKLGRASDAAAVFQIIVEEHMKSSIANGAKERLKALAPEAMQ